MPGPLNRKEAAGGVGEKTRCLRLPGVPGPESDGAEARGLTSADSLFEPKPVRQG